MKYISLLLNHVCVLLYFSNPNMVESQDQFLPISKEKNRFKSVLWEQYDHVHQKYMDISKLRHLFYFNLNLVSVNIFKTVTQNQCSCFYQPRCLAISLRHSKNLYNFCLSNILLLLIFIQLLLVFY